MKTIHTDVFHFDELDDDAKEKARTWWREEAFHDDWWDSVYDDAKQALKNAGWTIDKIYFSGFWSQGDGACFEGSWRAPSVVPDKMREYTPLDDELNRIASQLAEVTKEFPHASGAVKQSGHYYHEMCTIFDFEPGDDDAEEVENLIYNSPEYKQRADKVQRAENDFIELSRDAMRWVYRQLEKEYDFQNSDEQVDENIRINEYTFTATGRRFG